MYSIGDKISHPMHGAGIIEDIVSERVGGEVRQYYVMRLTYGSMTVMIPAASFGSIGVRRIISAEEADKLVTGFSAIQIEDNQNWNKRYRENMLKIKSGDLYQVAQVVKSLVVRDKERGLSTGERKLLSSSRQILISELMLAKEVSSEEIEHIINRSLIGMDSE